MNINRWNVVRHISSQFSIIQTKWSLILVSFSDQGMKEHPLNCDYVVSRWVLQIHWECLWYDVCQFKKMWNVKHVYHTFLYLHFEFHVVWLHVTRITWGTNSSISIRYHLTNRSWYLERTHARPDGRMLDTPPGIVGEDNETLLRQNSDMPRDYVGPKWAMSAPCEPPRLP